MRMDSLRHTLQRVLLTLRFAAPHAAVFDSVFYRFWLCFLPFLILVFFCFFSSFFRRFFWLFLSLFWWRTDRKNGTKSISESLAAHPSAFYSFWPFLSPFLTPHFLHVIAFYSCVYLFFSKECEKLDSVYFFAHNSTLSAEKYTQPAFSIRKVYTISIYETCSIYNPDIILLRAYPDHSSFIKELLHRSAMSQS